MSTRIGVVGTGYISRFHFKAFQTLGAKVVRVADLNGEAAQAAAAPFGAAVSAQWQDVVSAPDVDTVAVFSPTPLHAPVVRAALEAGKHVVCEKTLSLSTADSLALARLAESRGLLLFTSFMKRFFPAVQLGKSLMPRLGHITSVYCRTYQGVGKAALHTGTAPKTASHAAALRRLIALLLAPETRDRAFLGRSGNRAAVVGGRTRHLALSPQNSRSPLADLLPRLLGERDYTPLAGEPSLTVHVGRTPYVESLGLDFDTLHPFGYHIVMRDGRNLVLAGKSDRGNVYAVTDFLKRYLGYRRFGGSPELNEITPKSEALTLPSELAIRAEPSIHSYILAWSGATATFGRNSRLTCQATHALDRVVPPSEYGVTHPEYFPMVNGERISVKANGKIGGPWNPCVTNPDMPKLVAKYADKFFAEHPDHIGLPMGVNDGGGDCQCPDCSAELAETGNQYARFYNMAARVLAEKHPGKLVSFIAYSSAARQAPRGVRMEPNVLVEVTGMGRDVYGRLDEWQKAGVKHFGIYDYIYPFGSGYVTPRYYPRIMAKLWREAHAKYGIKTFWMEYYPKSTIFDAPRQYVLDELAWNINEDVEALLDDYFSALYAESAKPVKQFFDLHEMVYARKIHKNAPMLDWQAFKQMDEYTREDLAAMDAALEEAKRLVRDELARRRLDLLDKTWRFSRQRIEGNIVARELAGITKIESVADADRVVDLVGRGYSGIAAAAAFEMSPEDEKLVFHEGLPKSGLSTLKEFSRLLPQPNFEKVSDPALERMTAYLEGAGIDVDEYCGRAAEKHEEARAAFMTQSYIRNNKLVNMVRNPSFEDSDGDSPPPLLGDHVALKGVPGWSSWTFPSSVTRFFLQETEAKSGKRAAAIGEMQIGGSLISYVALQPNCRYRLSFWVRRNRGDEGFGMGSASVRMQGRGKWLDNGSAIVIQYPESCEDNWVQCSTSFTAPDEPATALILLGATKQSPGAWTAFDDVSLELIYRPDYTAPAGEAQ